MVSVESLLFTCVTVYLMERRNKLEWSLAFFLTFKIFHFLCETFVDLLWICILALDFQPMNHRDDDKF